MKSSKIRTNMTHVYTTIMKQLAYQNRTSYRLSDGNIRIRNDLWCVEWDVKLCWLTIIKSHICSFYSAPQSFASAVYDTACHFSQWFRPKQLKICYKVLLSKNFQRQISCSAVTSNGLNILAGDNPVPVKFVPKGTDPMMFHTRRAVQSATANFLVDNEIR